MSQQRTKHAAVLGLFALLTCVLSAQDQPPRPEQNTKPDTALHSLSVDVDVVLATVTVTDRSGRFVTGLFRVQLAL